MIPVQQSIVGGKDAPVPGDCFRACIASILERPLSEVPHFVHEARPNQHSWMGLVDNWLADEGYPFVLHEDAPLGGGWSEARWYLDGRWERVGIYRPGWWIAVVESKVLAPPAEHVVVMNEGRIVWDPSPHFGRPEYDERPWVPTGYSYTFAVPEPHLIPRRGSLA